MATRMQQRRGTAAQWISTNSGNGPILAAGEIGWESDNNKFKIGDGVNHWVDLDYFTTDSTSAIQEAIDNLIGGAPGTLDTLNELAAAIADDPEFFTTIATNLSNHESEFLNVHGIADTRELATKEYVTTEIGNSTVDQSALAGTGIDWNLGTEQFDIDSTVATKTYADEAEADAISAAALDATTKANAAQAAAELTASGALSTHASDTTGIHGIADTSELATKAYADEAVYHHSLDTTSVHGIADTTALATKTYADSKASDAQAAAISAAATDATTKANNAQSGAEATAASALSSHESDTTNIHGIANTADLATKTYAEGKATDAETAAKAYTDTRETAITTAYQSYADTAEADAKSYADQKVAALVDSAPATLDTLNELAAALQDNPDIITDLQDIAAGKQNTLTAGSNIDITADTISVVSLAAADISDFATASQTANIGYYDPAGSASAAETNAAQDATNKANQALSDAQNYANSLASNYDPAGSASTAQTNAQNYADSLASNYDVAGSATTAENAAKFYADGLISGLSGSGTASVAGNIDILTGTGIIVNGSNNSVEVDFQELNTRYDSSGAADSAEQDANLYTDNAISALNLSTTYDARGAAATVQTNLDNHALDTSTHGVGTVVGTSEAQTLTNKTISNLDNTITVQVANVSDLTATATELNILDGITASTTELNYVDGVTSSVQDQLDAKMPLAGGTFSGTVYGTNLELSGNLTVDGTFSSVPTETLTVTNPMIYMGDGNPSNINDLGLVGSHTIDSVYSHTGLVKDATDGKWKLFTGVTDEPTTTINFSQATLDTLVAATFEGNVTGNLTGDVTGNADTATALETARNIAGQSFDGTADISIAPTDLTGVTATAAEINILDGATLSTTELNYVDGVTSSIQDQIDSKLASSTAASTYAPIANPTFTGTVAGVTKSMVGLGNVDNTADADKPVSSATQTALNLKADLNAPTFSGTVSLPSTTTIGDVSATEIGHLDGVTSAIQGQIDSKQSTLIPGTGIDVTGANISIDNAELSNYLLEGVSGSSYGLIGTSTYLNVKNTNGYNKEIELDIAAVESKLEADGFAKLNAPTFTGTVSGITASMVGLGNVDNTSDADKPVSTATQTALDLKASLTGTETLTNKTLENPTVNVVTTVPGSTETITAALLNYPFIYTGEMYGNNLEFSLDYQGANISGNTVTTDMDYFWNQVPATITSPSSLSSFQVVFTGNIGQPDGNGFGQFSPVGDPTAWNAAKEALYPGANSPTTGQITFTFTGQTAPEQSVTTAISPSELINLNNVSSNIQTQLNAKAPLASPALTGSPTAPTQSAGDNSTKIATTAYADAAVAALVDSAPSTLNTLNELAAAINDDASYAATITTALGNKQDKVSGVSSTEIGYLSSVTSDIQTQLDSKLDSSSLSGYATESYVGDAINNIVGSAPGTLDTLQELATAINNDPNFLQNIDSLPSQNGNAGKYLTTNGTIASWAPAATESIHSFAMIG